MVMKHRFVAVSRQKRSICLGICCCPVQDTLFFTLKESSSPLEENDLIFPIATKLTTEEMSSIFDFVYGDVQKTGVAASAHSLSLLVHDGVIKQPQSQLPMLASEQMLRA